MTSIERTDNPAGAQELIGIVRAEIAAIWGELLGVAEIQPDDDFFLLGGYSLMAIKVRARIEQRFGVTVALAELFENVSLNATTGLVVDRLCADLDDSPTHS